MSRGLLILKVERTAASLSVALWELYWGQCRLLRVVVARNCLAVERSVRCCLEEYRSLTLAVLHADIVGLAPARGRIARSARPEVYKGSSTDRCYTSRLVMALMATAAFSTTRAVRILLALFLVIVGLW